MQSDTKPRGGNMDALLLVFWPRGLMPLMADERKQWSDYARNLDVLWYHDLNVLLR